MPNALSSQGGATKTSSAPPIPVMDQSAPAAPSASVRDQARVIAKQARAEAAKAAQSVAQGGAATPAIATSTPAPFSPSELIPPQVVDISMAFFFTVAFCIVGFPIARAIARRMDRRGDLPSSTGPDLRPQIQQLQQSVDAMAIELERISEGQRFTTKVLTERAGVSK